jgi:hypothetical protein
VKSRWYEYKDRARVFRRKGLSIVVIEDRLGIPRSTLSGWFKNIKLSKLQQRQLLNKKLSALKKARESAVIAHNNKKQLNVDLATNKAKTVIKKLDFEDDNLIKIALAMLYLGEGFKKSKETGLGNSDPLIVRFFLFVLLNYYSVPISQVRCELYIRHDQDVDRIKEFWSKQLKLPKQSFSYVHKDKRTMNNPSHDEYFGVCAVRCGHIAIQRELLYLSREFCKRITSESL